MSLLTTTRAYGFNPSHWAAPRLLFAWRGGAAGGRRVQNAVRGRENLTQTTAPIVASRDGWGVSSTGASEYWSATVRSPSAYASSLTMLWRGVVLGDAGTTSYGRFMAVNYGTGAGAPFLVFGVARKNSAPNNIVIFSNDGASFVESNTDVSLTSYYNIPLTIAVSNAAGSNALTMIIGSPSRGFISKPSLNVLTGTSGNPRATSATDTILIGDSTGAGCFPNSVTTGAAVWNIAMNEQQLRDVAMRSDMVFAAPSQMIADALMYTEPSIPAGAGGTSGYKPFKGPFGHPFNVPL
jgi:hypothetical protein